MITAAARRIRMARRARGAMKGRARCNERRPDPLKLIWKGRTRSISSELRLRPS